MCKYVKICIREKNHFVRTDSTRSKQKLFFKIAKENVCLSFKLYEKSKLIDRLHMNCYYLFFNLAIYLFYPLPFIC